MKVKMALFLILFFSIYMIYGETLIGEQYSISPIEDIKFLENSIKYIYLNESNEWEHIEYRIEYISKNRLTYLQFLDEPILLNKTLGLDNNNIEGDKWLILSNELFSFAYNSQSQEPINNAFGGRITHYFHIDTEILASSYLIEKQTHFSSENLESKALNSPWVEGLSGQGIGETIELKAFSIEYNKMRESLGKSSSSVYGNYTKKYRGFYISIGYVSFDKPYLYEYNSRPSKIRIYNDNLDMIVDLQDTPNPQWISFESYQDNVSIELLEVYEGTKYDDTCVNFIIPINEIVEK